VEPHPGFADQIEKTPLQLESVAREVIAAVVMENTRISIVVEVSDPDLHGAGIHTLRSTPTDRGGFVLEVA